MNTNQASTHRRHPAGCQYALRRGVDYWALVFEGREAVFKHELGALCVAYLLQNPPPEPLHAVALALKVRDKAGQAAGFEESLEERNMGLEEARAVRALWRRQRELEAVLADRHEIEPVKAEVLRELEEVTEFLRASPWLSRHGAERCANAVTRAIKRFYARLAVARNAEGRPDEVLQAFAQHLYEHLLIPSGRSCGRAGHWVASVPAGCFTYEPPKGVVWSAECEGRNPKSEGRSPTRCDGATARREEIRNPKAESEAAGSEIGSPRQVPRRPAALVFLARFLCAGFALALLLTGCAGPRPLKGGKATTTRNQAGLIQQTVAQGENAQQPTKQDQETIKVRSYTLPAATRIEQGPVPVAAPAPVRSADKNVRAPSRAQPSSELSTLPPPQDSYGGQATAYVLSAPMPVGEREETRARTELGAAQKDTARDLAAKLSSLKGIVWVGVGLFIFGLASLVYPPLKVIVASVTTSVALMLGGVALIVLPTMVVGNELLILGVVALVVGAWFLAHRHGQLSGLVAVEKQKAG